jgi:hypothetical protein
MTAVSLPTTGVSFASCGVSLNGTTTPILPVFGVTLLGLAVALGTANATVPK